MSEALPYVQGCTECARLKRETVAARAQRDPSREVDYRVLTRRHLRVTHDIKTMVGS